MPYAASSAAGTQLLLSTGSPVSYAFVPGVEGLTPSGQQKNTIEVTAISDTSKKFIPDLPDNGEFSFNLFWDPTESTHAAILANFNDTSDALLYFKVLMDNAAASFYTFDGYITGFVPSHQKGQANMVSVTVKVSGALSLTV